MIYIVFGNQRPTIRSRIKKIVKESVGETDDLNFAKLDASEVDFAVFNDEATFLPLGYDKKVISYEECSFLALEDKSLKNIDHFNEFIKTLENNDDNIDIILSFCPDKDKPGVNEKNRIFQVFKEHGKIFKLEDPTPAQWHEYVEKYIKDVLGCEIDRDALLELEKRTQGNQEYFKNSANVLGLYTKHITINDVSLMVEKPLEDRVFLIYNQLLLKKVDIALSILKDLETKNTEPTIIVSSLATQFRLLHQIMYLSSNNYSLSDIAKETGISETRAQIISKQVYLLDYSRVNEILEDLYNLDVQNKSGQSDRYYNLELFILKFAN